MQTPVEVDSMSYSMYDFSASIIIPVFMHTDEYQWGYNYNVVHTSDMQGMVWGEPELSHVWVFDHMVFFHSHK